MEDISISWYDIPELVLFTRKLQDQWFVVAWMKSSLGRLNCRKWRDVSRPVSHMATCTFVYRSQIMSFPHHRMWLFTSNATVAIRGTVTAYTSGSLFQLHDFMFLFPCCDVRCGFRVKIMFGSSLLTFVFTTIPIELELKNTTDKAMFASYIDLHLQIDSEDRLRTKLSFISISRFWLILR